MFTLPQIKVNLFDLYLTSPGEEIIIKFLSLTQDGFRVRINNSEVELPLRNFTVRRLISRFNIYKIAVITDSGDKPSYLVYVDETMCVKIDQAIVGLLEAKMPQMSAVNLADHPERWSLSELVFTNADNSIIMYYTGQQAECHPVSHGFVENCEKTSILNGGFADPLKLTPGVEEYWTIDHLIEDYQLQPVEDDAKCHYLRQLAKQLPPVPSVSAVATQSSSSSDGSQPIRSGKPWHQRYYPARREHTETRAGNCDSDDDEPRVRSGGVYRHVDPTTGRVSTQVAE